MKKLTERLKMDIKKGKDTYIAGNATVFGEVTLGDNVSIWHGVIIRADVHEITVGDDSNIQDGSIVHVTNDKYPTHIGKRVTIGHGVKLHGCTIEDDVLVGIGAIILDGAVIGKNSIIAAGSLVPPRKVIPEGSMVMGSPAKVVKQLSEEEMQMIYKNAKNYVKYKDIYIENNVY